MKNNKRIHNDGIGHLTWRSYNSIKKKAMEQEFSWSGLVVSLSIAFFITIGTAQALSVTYQSIINKQQEQQAHKLEIQQLNSQTAENYQMRMNSYA